jgi:hypothetical protein
MTQKAMLRDDSIPIFFKLRDGLLVNINCVAWVESKKGDTGATIGLSVSLPEGGNTVRMEAGKYLDDVLATIASRADRRSE